MDRSPIWVVKDNTPEEFLGLIPNSGFPLEIVAIPPIKVNKYTLHIRPALKFFSGNDIVYEFTMESVLQIGNTVNPDWFFAYGVTFGLMVIDEYNEELRKKRSPLTHDKQHPIPTKEELYEKIKTAYFGNSIN